MTHASKESPITDRFFSNARYLGVCDGVAEVAAQHLDPAAMAVGLCYYFPAEMDKRLEKNGAQKYDRDACGKLQSPTPPDKGGWLKNLVALSFLQASSKYTVGSSTLAVCHLTWKQLSCVTLGDCCIYVYRGSSSIGAREISTDSH